MRGVAELNKPTGDAFQRAREMLARAIALDPNYVRAHAAVAFSHTMDLLTGASTSRADSLKGLETAARTAVALDPDDSMAQMVMSFFYTWSEQDALALATAAQAVSLNLNNAGALGHLGTLLDLVGRHEEGIANLERALRLNPKEPTTAHVYRSFLARAHLALGSYEQAATWARDSLAQRGGYVPARYLLGLALAHLGQTAEARATLEECERQQPGFLAQRQDWRPYRDDALNLHFKEGLRKAGLI